MPPSVNTAKGHLTQERQGLQSTKIKTQHDDFNPKQEIKNEKTKCFMAKIQQFTATDKAYSDLTGRFPVQSSRGNNYVMVVYCYDANAIIAEPLKNRSTGEIVKAWNNINQKLENAGVCPSIYILDNEISQEFKQALKKKDIQFQLVPPHIHRANAAERAIQTFKDHFLAGLSSCNPQFPLREWDRLLHQAVITLNLLRNARQNPKLSAYAFLFGTYDFTRYPLAPPGTKIVVHAKPTDRASWGFHGRDGWTIGPSLEHYRCIKCFIPTTKSEINSDTLAFFPHEIPLPQVSTEDYLKQATQDIISLLTNPISFLPSLKVGDTTKNAMLEIAQLLHRSITDIVPFHLPINKKNIPVPPSIGKNSPIKKSSNTNFPSNQNNVRLPRVPHNKSHIVPPPRVQRTNPDHLRRSPRIHQRSTVPLPIRAAYNIPLPKQSPRKQTIIKNTVDQILEAVITKLPSPINLSPKTPKQHALNELLNWDQKAFDTFLYPTINHIYDVQGKKQTVHNLLASDQKVRWTRALSNEFGRLAQGNIHGVAHTDTIDFISKSDVPKNKKVTYATFVCDHRPLKSEPWRIRCVVGGDKLPYYASTSSPAASMMDTKLMLNSVISDAHQGARFLSADLKDFFLGSRMKFAEYMRIPFNIFPADIIATYNLTEKACEDGYIYIRIKKGMYGLKQAAILAYNQLKNHLKPYGYAPIAHSMSLWTHTSRRTKFCLCVDDFGIKYFSQDDAMHLLDALKTGYPTSVDWKGQNYCGYRLDWQYTKGYVDMSMPTYIPKMLAKYNHKKPTRLQKAPHQWSAPVYGKKRQYAKSAPDLPVLPKHLVTEIQQKSGSLLYYARALDYTLLPSLSDISTTQAKPTANTAKEVDWLFDYVATYPLVKIRFHASDMILHVESDAAYLIAPGAKSRIAGYYYLSNKDGTFDNPPFFVLCQLLRHVVASAAESETAGTFFNAREIIHLRRHLIALGHPQPPTVLKTDNSTTAAFIHKNMKLKKSKSWDMRFFWLRDAELLKQLVVKWARGTTNKADYFTKHFPPSYHVRMRPTLFLNWCQHFFARTLQVPVPTTDRTPQFPKSPNTLPSYRRTLSTPTRTQFLARANSKRRVHFPLVNSTTLRGCVGTNIFPRRLNIALVRYLTSAY